MIHELPEEERICPECGGPLHECGRTVLWRELTYIPAQYKVVEHVQTTYSCRCCERTNDHVPTKKSAVPPALLPGSGVVSPSLLAHILHSKYVLALPLYRQEQELQRVGVLFRARPWRSGFLPPMRDGFRISSSFCGRNCLQTKSCTRMKPR